MDSFVGSFFLIEFHSQGLLHMGFLPVSEDGIQKYFTGIDCSHTQKYSLPKPKGCAIEGILIPPNREEVLNKEKAYSPDDSENSNH